MKLKFTNKMKGANKFNNKAGIVSSISSSNNVNRQCLSADGFSLLPSALRPCLFCLVLVLVFGFTTLGVFNSSTVFATTSTLTVNIASSISLDLNPIYPNGTFASSSTSDNTISVKTDNFTGYTLGIAAKTANNNALTYTNNNVVVATVPSITSAVSATNYADNTYATTNHLNNTWGFRPSKYNSVDNTVTNNYYPAPTSTEINNIVLDTTSAANPTTFNNYNIAIGARVDADTPTGSYTNTFVITAVANAINYTITYNKGNTTDTVTNLPANQTGTLGSPGATTDITLTSNTPSRSGRSFIGWCSELPTAGDTDTCGGNTYAAGGNYPLNATTNPNVTLYAMWMDPCAGHDAWVYCKVKSMSKGTQDIASLKTAIVTPTAAATISSNSGVYEYNTSVFGADSDATNSSGGKDTIYYYRGILDSYGNMGTYGSDGLADAYPNYVILQAGGSKATTDTCWRIIRTTGSGGTKMIYNGKWTGSSCANSMNDASALYGPNDYFNRPSAYAGYDERDCLNSNAYCGTRGFLTYVGYNYNSTYAYNNTSYTSSIPNENHFSNGTASNMRIKIEEWYNNNITNYASILETSAGWCNDRTTYTNETASSLVDSTVPYSPATGFKIYFGAYIRNYTASVLPTLGCPNTTGYDLLTTDSGLGAPIALLTADEATLAGSGPGGSGKAPFHANSYLGSGSRTILLSPEYATNGNPALSAIDRDGHLWGRAAYTSYSSRTSSTLEGTRPAISLISGTTAASGTGTATDPWVVTAP